MFRQSTSCIFGTRDPTIVLNITPEIFQLHLVKYYNQDMFSGLFFQIINSIISTTSIFSLHSKNLFESNSKTAFVKINK